MCIWNVHPHFYSSKYGCACWRHAVRVVAVVIAMALCWLLCAAALRATALALLLWLHSAVCAVTSTNRRTLTARPVGEKVILYTQTWDWQTASIDVVALLIAGVINASSDFCHHIAPTSERWYHNYICTSWSPLVLLPANFRHSTATHKVCDRLLIPRTAVRCHTATTFLAQTDMLVPRLYRLRLSSSSAGSGVLRIFNIRRYTRIDLML